MTELNILSSFKSDRDRCLKNAIVLMFNKVDLLMWCLDRIARLPPCRLPTQIGQVLATKYDKLRRGEVKVSGKDAMIRVLCKAVALLFRELYREIKPH